VNLQEVVDKSADSSVGAQAVAGLEQETGRAQGQELTKFTIAEEERRCLRI